MKFNTKTLQTTITFLIIVLMTLKVVGQTVLVGKYDTTNYPKDRKIINNISNIFDKSLSLNDDPLRSFFLTI